MYGRFRCVFILNNNGVGFTRMELPKQLATLEKPVADCLVFEQLGRGQKVYLVGETKPFRHLARTLPLPGPPGVCVEVGSSYGDTLNIIAKRTDGRVTGFDVSKVKI